MRAVVDTNVWVSALIRPSGPPSRVLRAFRNGRFDLVESEPLMEELAEVLARPRLVRRYGYTAEDVADLLAVLRRAEFVLVAALARIVRDPDDDMVVATAIQGRVDAVVTRDDDIKGDASVVRHLREVGIAVLTVQHFLNALAESDR